MFDALLSVSFGGPEGPDDVIPFLQNVTRGRAIPPERLRVVGEHYLRFGGVSPINAQCRALIDGLEHSDTADYEDPIDGEEGENLWRGTKGYYSPEQMVNLWVDERRIFVNGPFPRNSTTGQWRDVGHYTQLVWRSTTEVGCAIASSDDDDVLVCRYLEGGNVIGEKPY